MIRVARSSGRADATASLEMVAEPEPRMRCGAARDRPVVRPLPDLCRTNVGHPMFRLARSCMNGFRRPLLPRARLGVLDMPIDPFEFRETLGRWCSGVTVVTMRDGETVHGITVSAFSSLSLDPPLIGIAIALRARAHGYLERVTRFGVSILSEDQRHLSEHFAGRSRELSEGPFVEFGELPLIRGALAHIACTVVERVPVGDHTLYVGQIELTNLTDLPPLAYHRGQYGRFA